MLYRYPAEPTGRRLFSRRERSRAGRLDMPLNAWQTCLVGAGTGLFMGLAIAVSLLM